MSEGDYNDNDYKHGSSSSGSDLEDLEGTAELPPHSSEGDNYDDGEWTEEEEEDH